MSETLSDEELNEIIAGCRGLPRSFTAYTAHKARVSPERVRSAFSELLAARKKLAELEADGRFLIDRLTDFYWGDLSEEAYREFAGHVVPAMERIRAALPSIPKGD